MNPTVVYTIAKRELRSYFATPLALIFLVVFLVLLGFFTFKLGNFFEIGQADLRAFFVWHPWLYMFIVPAISMRLWAEEKRSGTVELLLTLPVTVFEAVTGKFLAAWIFLGLALLLTTPIVWTVNYLGTPDNGVIVAGYLGSFLLAGTFLAVGTIMSACTNNQVVSFVLSTFCCLFMVLMGYEPVIDVMLQFAPEPVVDGLTKMSFPYHFEAIQRGVIDTRDLFYFLSLMIFGLLAASVVIERTRAD
ncbi:MAG: ABC transporter permease [bacterium]|nr:ABC transporter permease [bacterium]